MKNLLIAITLLASSSLLANTDKNPLPYGRLQCTVTANNILKAFRMVDKEIPQIDVFTSSIEKAKHNGEDIEIMTYVIEDQNYSKSMKLTMFNHGSKQFCNLVNVEIKRSQGK